jgi:hypothetical protein
MVHGYLAWGEPDLNNWWTRASCWRYCTWINLLPSTPGFKYLEWSTWSCLSLSDSWNNWRRNTAGEREYTWAPAVRPIHMRAGPGGPINHVLRRYYSVLNGIGAGLFNNNNKGFYYSTRSRPARTGGHWPGHKLVAWTGEPICSIYGSEGSILVRHGHFCLGLCLDCS